MANTRKFTIIESDIDYQIYQKTLIGKLTKQRVKSILRWARLHTKRTGHCGHEYDCCGCLSSTTAEVSFDSQSETTITLTAHYNY